MPIEPGSVLELARQLALRELSAEALLHRCFEAIEAREPVVRAFAHFDRDRALAAARDADRGAVRGALHGLPVGMKDIIETSDQPTDYGSRLFRGNFTGRDADCVARTRGAGGLVIGKTVTTEFATFGPGPTTNPHDSSRTPGGSSSGSAAGVAAGMFPLGIGTQTVGSIVRPAAFCGVVGFKPSFGVLSRAGVKEISPSLDTIGCFAGSVAGAAFFAGVLAGTEPQLLGSDVPAPSFAIARTPFWRSALPETVSLFEGLPAALARAGASAQMCPLPDLFAALTEAQVELWEFEMARCLADVRMNSIEQVHPILATQLVRGAAIPQARHDEIQHLAGRARKQFEDFFRHVDALIVPAATGEAPVGLGSIGDNTFNRGWNMLHGPIVQVPMGVGPNGLPLGVQVIGSPGRDLATLAAAHWLESNVSHASQQRRW